MMVMQVNTAEADFECGTFDVMCTAFESIATGLGGFVGWLAENMLGSQNLAPGTNLWDVAINEASQWFAIGILVSIGIGIIGLSTGALSLSPGKVGWSILGILSGIPATMLTLTLGGALLGWSDDISEAVLERIGGPDGFTLLFKSLLLGNLDSSMGAGTTFATGGVTVAMPTIAILLILILGLVFMTFALAFRNLALMVLVAFSPLAFMAVGTKGGWQLARKWAFAGIALLISKPLMFGVLAMILKTADNIELFSPETLTVATGLFVVSFMPMMAYSFFNFLGGSAEQDAGGSLGSSAGQKATSTTQMVAGRMRLPKVGRGAGGAAGKSGAPGVSGKSGAGGLGGKNGAGGSKSGSSGGGGTSSGSGGGGGSKGGSPTVPQQPVRGAAPKQSPPKNGKPNW